MITNPTSGIRIGFKTAQIGVDWPTLLATWQLADELEVFDSGWIFDHFDGMGDQRGCHEAMIAATALGASTRRLTYGHLVLSVTHRHPALVARMAATLDQVTPGRFVLGLGAGWRESEHTMFGWPFPTIRERLDQLEASIRVIRAMWAAPAGATLDAGPYHLDGATCEPGPVTPSGPPIWLGTQGERRGLRIVAELADGWNALGTLAEFRSKREALLRHCEAVRRDPSEIEISAQLFRGDSGLPGQLRDAQAFVEAGARHLVLVLPAGEGPTGLERLADEVATPLRERYGAAGA
jgi:alkanesulfonate monooxygenase SsuD/methylene tetrahydromethanopterin reductase-like flavin-dependent oxidoreductase (luciferase family)